jgi:hypothetical protein
MMKMKGLMPIVSYMMRKAGIATIDTKAAKHGRTRASFEVELYANLVFQ